MGSMPIDKKNYDDDLFCSTNVREIVCVHAYHIK